MLALGRGDARQLARSRPTHRAVVKRLLERRQGLERLRHAQPFLRPAGLVPEQALDVFGEGSKPQMEMNPGSKADEQGSPFLPIDTVAAGRQTHEGFVRVPPVER